MMMVRNTEIGFEQEADIDVSDAQHYAVQISDSRSEARALLKNWQDRGMMTEPIFRS